MVYHRSCCKSYTTKHNIAVYVNRKCGTTGSDQDSTVSTILTLSQSGPIDWNVCIFCNNKTYKNVKTLKKIESIERISRILDAPNHYSDSSVTHKTSQEHFKERAKSKEPAPSQYCQNHLEWYCESGIFYQTWPNTSGCISQPFILFYAQFFNRATNDRAFNAGDNIPEVQTDGLRKC